MRFLPCLILGISLLVSPVPGQAACGTIVQTGATIDVGPGTPGTLTIDPCAIGGTPPDIPDPGTIGAVPGMTGTLPAFPGGGTGADGAYHATADTTLAAGTWNFTVFEIDNTVTVTCDGAVTINVTGRAIVNGKLHSTADAASIEIRCGGSFSMEGQPAGIAAIETTGVNAHIDVITNDISTIMGRTHVTAASGDVRIVVLGTAETGAAATFDAADIDTLAGDLTLISRHGMDLAAVSINSGSGSLLAQSFESDVTVSRSGYLTTDYGPETAIEGYTGVTVTGSAYVENTHVPIRLLSPAGTVRLDDHCTVDTAGNITVNARDEVIFFDSPLCESLGGDLTIACHQGDVSIETTGPGPWGSANVRTDGGVLDIRAHGTVAIGGMARLRGGAGSIDIRAVTGDFTMVQNAQVGTNVDRDCPVDIRAAGKIDARVPAQSSGGGHIRGESILLSAGDDGIWLEQDEMRAHDAPGIRMFSSGTITIRNPILCYYDSILLSTRTEVDVTGQTIHTDSTEGPSGAVTLESWGAASGRIDATDATVTSGAGGPSGDVSLLVRTPGGAPPPATVESFILPKRIQMKLNAKKPEKSKLIAAGIFDTGPDPVDLTMEATLTVGGLEVSIPGLELAPSGKQYRYRDDRLTFLIKPNRRGSSRAKFKLSIKDDLAGKVDPDAVLEIRFECDGMEGRGACTLTSGKFALKKVRGTLIEPTLHLWRMAAKVKGGGKDALKFIVGLATSGPVPATVPDVRVVFGDAIDVTIPAASFERVGDAFLFKGDADGITMVKVDFAKEAVVVKGKNLDLGTFSEGANSMLLGVEIGGEGGIVGVRVNLKGSQLRY
ncbi:MAG: hypothetical protein ABFS86_08785 [Planctomycetota bacterium]